MVYSKGRKYPGNVAAEKTHSFLCSGMPGCDIICGIGHSLYMREGEGRALMVHHVAVRAMYAHTESSIRDVFGAVLDYSDNA